MCADCCCLSKFPTDRSVEQAGQKGQHIIQSLKMLCKVAIELITVWAAVHSFEQKSIGLKFSKSRTRSHVTYSCHHNLTIQNYQRDALNVIYLSNIITLLYMFRVSSTHLQEDIVVHAYGTVTLYKRVTVLYKSSPYSCISTRH